MFRSIVSQSRSSGMPSADRSRIANRIMISGPHVKTVEAFGSMSDVREERRDHPDPVRPLGVGDVDA